jgi:hypothetical protein
MAFIVDNIKIGNRMVAINNRRVAMGDYLATLTSRHLAIKLDRTDGKKVGLEIPRRQMKRVEVSLNLQLPFLAFQLKPAGYKALAKKMGEKVDGWIVVFFYMGNFNNINGITDVEGMVKTLLEYNRNLLGPEEASELLITVGCSKQEIIHRISNLSIQSNTTVNKVLLKFAEEGKHEAVTRYQFFIRKLAAFLQGGAEVKISETDEIFPKVFMMIYTQEYLKSLECVKCGDRAFSFCSVCLETRYCGKDCQDAIQEQHKEECARLVEERQAKKAFEEEVVKKMVPDNRRKAFAKYEGKMSASWRKYARESLKETERDPAIMAAGRVLDFPPWLVTIYNI